MSEMRLPGFTAESSMDWVSFRYNGSRTRRSGSNAHLVTPQAKSSGGGTGTKLTCDGLKLMAVFYGSLADVYSSICEAGGAGACVDAAYNNGLSVGYLEVHHANC